MAEYYDAPLNLEVLSGGEVNSEPIEAGSRMENPMTQLPCRLGERGEAGNDKCAEEREKQLERWMANVKAFIRGIDINSL